MIDCPAIEPCGMREHVKYILDAKSTRLLVASPHCDECQVSNETRSPVFNSMYLFTTISNKLIHKSSSVFNLTYRIHQDAAAGNALSGSLSYLVLPEENPSLNNCDEVGAWHCTPSKWYVSLYKINFMDINVPALTLTSIPRLHRCFKLV